jgi:hypothetical protein
MPVCDAGRAYERLINYKNVSIGRDPAEKAAAPACDPCGIFRVPSRFSKYFPIHNIMVRGDIRRQAVAGPTDLVPPLLPKKGYFPDITISANLAVRSLPAKAGNLRLATGKILASAP